MDPFPANSPKHRSGLHLFTRQVPNVFSALTQQSRNSVLFLRSSGLKNPSVVLCEQKTLVDAPLFSSSLWGPSGDDLDQVVEHCLLPELHIGDWLVFKHAGAFSLGQPLLASTDSPPPPIFYFIFSRDW